jgi:hypothetical protein
MNATSLGSRALHMAALRIGLVAAFAGVVSYTVNRNQIDEATRRQLLLSTAPLSPWEGSSPFHGYCAPPPLNIVASVKGIHEHEVVEGDTHDATSDD